MIRNPRRPDIVFEGEVGSLRILGMIAR